MMKNSIVLMTLLLVTACSSSKQGGLVNNQSSSEEIIMLGELSYQDIVNTLERWQLADEQVVLDSAEVAALSAIAGPVEMTCFLGTWCSDSRRGVPLVMRTLKAAGNENIHLRLIGVDRAKDDPDHLGPQNNIELVPTFILYEAGEETARLVETPLLGNFVQDMLQLLE